MAELWSQDAGLNSEDIWPQNCFLGWEDNVFIDTQRQIIKALGYRMQLLKAAKINHFSEIHKRIYDREKRQKDYNKQYKAPTKITEVLPEA